MTEHSLKTPRVLFAPAAGTDLRACFARFGDAIDHFLFVDLAYRRRAVQGLTRPQVPHAWTRLGSNWQVDDSAPLRGSPHTGQALFPAAETCETWQRADGTRVRITLRRDLDDAALAAQPLGSISVCLLPSAQTANARAVPGTLLDSLVPRLSSRALVLAEPGSGPAVPDASARWQGHGRDWTPALRFGPAGTVAWQVRHAA